MIADLWYKNAVIYSLDVETYFDANGDGVGDFAGLVRRLDYIDSLGVDTIWLAPFQPSPDRDDGYDISDHYGVDPRYGSSGDFVEFMRETRKRGLKVVLDLVVNHTSDAHPWFRSARESVDAPYRDWYVWSKKKPKNMKQGMVFPGFQESTWTWDKRTREYYYHRFFNYMPDLNTANPQVKREIERIMGYWLELGVKGFRVDAVPFLLEVAEPQRAKWQTDFDFLHDLRRFLQLRTGDAVLLGEANVPPPGEQEYFGARGDGLQMMFNFWVNQHLFYALATSDTRPLAAALRATRRLPKGAQWANFLRNHDELDLGRLSETQRQTVFDEFAPEKSMQLYDRGIRRRLAPMLGDRRRVELASSVMFSLPGTPVIRYGDEIGMGEDLSLPERAAVRTPMQWSDEQSAGFSRAEKTVHPVISGGLYGYERVNVEAQRRDPQSMLSWTVALIRLRKECPEIGWGDWDLVATGSNAVLGMRYEWQGNAVLVLHNFSSQATTARVNADSVGGRILTDLRIDETIKASNGRYIVALEPYDYRWFRVGPLTYALNREYE